MFFFLLYQRIIQWVVLFYVSTFIICNMLVIFMAQKYVSERYFWFEGMSSTCLENVKKFNTMGVDDNLGRFFFAPVRIIIVGCLNLRWLESGYLLFFCKSNG